MVQKLPLDPPFPSFPPSSPPSSSTSPWLPEDVGRIPSFEELLQLTFGGEESPSSPAPSPTASLLRQARALAAREEYWTPSYYPEDQGEGEEGKEGRVGGETLALRWVKEYMELGPLAFGEKHLPASGTGLERQVMRRLVLAKGKRRGREGGRGGSSHMVTRAVGSGWAVA